MSASLAVEARRVAKLLADPALSEDQRRRLLAIEADLARAAEEASINRQRRARFTQSRAVALAGEERVRVHPGGHSGACPASSGGWISRAEMVHGNGGIWHVDSDQMPPSWWPKTGLVIAPPTPAELSAQRARREVELKAAEAAERVSSRNVR